jgi:hypothetical protein
MILSCGQLTLFYVNSCSESVCGPNNRAPDGFRAMGSRSFRSVKRPFQTAALLQGKTQRAFRSTFQPTLTGQILESRPPADVTFISTPDTFSVHAERGKEVLMCS